MHMTGNSMIFSLALDQKKYYISLAHAGAATGFQPGGGKIFRNKKS